MSGRDRVLVENLTVRGVAAVEIVAIPGSEPDSRVMRIRLRHIDAAADDIGLADAIDTAAFRHGLAELNDSRAGRDAVARIDLAGESAGTIGEREGACG